MHIAFAAVFVSVNTAVDLLYAAREPAHSIRLERGLARSLSTFKITEGDFHALRDLIRARFGIFYDDQSSFCCFRGCRPGWPNAVSASYAEYSAFLRSGAAARERMARAGLGALEQRNVLLSRARAAEAPVRAGARRSARGQADAASDLVGGVVVGRGAVLARDRRCSRAAASPRPTSDPRHRHLPARAGAGAARVLPRAVVPRDRAADDRRSTSRRWATASSSPTGSSGSSSSAAQPDGSPRAIAAVGPVDAIFCRNVLIYFDKPTQKRVVEAFAKRCAGRISVLGTCRVAFSHDRSLRADLPAGRDRLPLRSAPPKPSREQAAMTPDPGLGRRRLGIHAPGHRKDARKRKRRSKSSATRRERRRGARARSTRARPDVITMDVEMPGMGGLEAVRKIVERARPDPDHHGAAR